MPVKKEETKQIIGGLESINEQSKKVAQLTQPRAPVMSYKDRRQVKKATEITQNSATTKALEEEIQKSLQEEKAKKEAEEIQAKKRFANVFGDDDEEDD